MDPSTSRINGAEDVRARHPVTTSTRLALLLRSSCLLTRRICSRRSAR